MLKKWLSAAVVCVFAVSTAPAQTVSVDERIKSYQKV